jgi:FHA domain
MDAFAASLWLLRFLFLGLLYLFLFAVVRILVRDLRAAAREPGTELGRLHVLTSPAGEPPPGAAFGLDAVTTIGRDVNNAIVVEDPFASAEHAVLTFRGRTWYIEDLSSTNGTYVNGSRIDGLAPIGFGDEIQIGQVRVRLERARR